MEYSYQRSGSTPVSIGESFNRVGPDRNDDEFLDDTHLGAGEVLSQESIRTFSVDRQGVAEVVKEDTVVGISNETDESQQAKQSKVMRTLGAITVVSALASLGFEQSPANEALRTAVGANVLEDTGSALAVGGVVGGVTMGIEGGSSALIALGLHQEKDAVRRLVNRFKKEADDDPIDVDKPKGPGKVADKVTDTGIALGIGAGLVVTKRHLQEAEPTLKKDLVTALGASAVVATVSGAIGYLAGGGINHAETVGLEEQAEFFIDYATDWKFWMGVVGVIQAGSWIKGRISKRSKEEKL